MTFAESTIRARATRCGLLADLAGQDWTNCEVSFSANYSSVVDPRLELRQRMREIAQTHVRYGYRRARTLLNREGWDVWKNLVWRLYTEEGLALRKKATQAQQNAGAA
jgi:hypothetical protein